MVWRLVQLYTNAESSVLESINKKKKNNQILTDQTLRKPNLHFCGYEQASRHQ